MIGDAISAANPTPFNPMGLPGQAISGPSVSDIGWARASVGANNSFMSGATGMVTTHNSLMGAIQDAHARPNSVHGKVQCDSLNVAIKKVGFTFYQMCVHKEHAISIDNFFTMYGYATKKVKIPNRNVRPYFTHTKTNDCSIIGELPADDNRKICAIYNKGITFWKNGANVGNYSLNNSPT